MTKFLSTQCITMMCILSSGKKFKKNHQEVIIVCSNHLLCWAGSDPPAPAPGPSPVMKSGAVVATGGHGQGPQTHLNVDTHLRCGRISSPASHIQPLEETQMN